MLNNRLIQWAEDYEVYVEAQAGFRKGYSTIDNLFVLHGLINTYVNSGKNCTALFWIIEKLSIILSGTVCG